MYKGKGPNMIAGKFDPHFPLKHAQKDVNLACALGEEVGQPLPEANATNEAFKSVLEAHGEEDFCSVIHAYKQ